MAPPAGPHASTPSARLPSSFAGSLIVYARHTTAPVSTSSATIEPRNVQHAYVGLFPASSYDEVGTYSRFLYNAGEPVNRISGWSSTFARQMGRPVAASRAYAKPF